MTERVEYLPSPHLASYLFGVRCAHLTSLGRVHHVTFVLRSAYPPVLAIHGTPPSITKACQALDAIQRNLASFHDNKEVPCNHPWDDPEYLMTPHTDPVFHILVEWAHVVRNGYVSLPSLVNAVELGKMRIQTRFIHTYKVALRKLAEERDYEWTDDPQLSPEQWIELRGKQVLREIDLRTPQVMVLVVGSVFPEVDMLIAEARRRGVCTELWVWDTVRGREMVTVRCLHEIA